MRDPEHTMTTSASTRRTYLKYGGTVVGGGLLAGCTGGPSPNGADDNSSDDDGDSGDTDESYSARLAPVGTVEFANLPESVLTILPHHADMATAAGYGEAVTSMLYNPEYNDTIWNTFLERLPDVSVDWAGLPGSWNPDKELLYELDSDLHLADPAYMTQMDGWTRDDIDEIAENVGPWFGNALSNANKKPPSEWADEYQYYTLWEIFEQVANVFQAKERYEALKAVHTELLARIEENLPSEDERPSVAMIILIQGEDSMYTYALNGPGFLTAHTRPLGAHDVFADIPTESTVDYEALVEANPDVILCLAGMSEARHVTKTRERFQDNSVTNSVTAVENDRIHTQGGRNQGPLMNLFQLEMTAKQLYPGQFGEWPVYEGGPYPDFSAEQQLFDRQRVADIINKSL